MGATKYVHMMEGFADVMATFGMPLPNEELIEYIIA
jgi:hypothetical protein